MKKSLGFFCPDNYLYLNKVKFIEYNGIKLKTDYLLSLIHDILIKFQLDDDDVEINEFCINLYSKILRDRYGLHYKNYIDYLIEIGFIKLKSNYFVGKKAKTYVLCWFDFGSIKRVLVYDTILIKNSFKEYHRKLNATSPIDLDIRKRLIEDLDSIKINFDKSIEFIDDLKNKDNITSSKYFKNYHSIVNIKDKNIYFIFDDFGRLHTNYTVLKKEIRKNYLTIDNEQIIEIDIKNSQPFFLSKIIKFEMNISDPEVKLFVDLVDNGLFYDYFVDKFPVYFSAQTANENRNIAKRLVYKVLFGYNGVKSEQSKMFKEIYPKIFDYIIATKKSEKEYKYFSYKLMRMESDFIFGKVVPDIYKKVKGIKLFTVHDSITYPSKYKEKVEEIFYYHLKNYDNFLNK
jgi:hypothetical protein